MKREGLKSGMNMCVERPARRPLWLEQCGEGESRGQLGEEEGAERSRGHCQELGTLFIMEHRRFGAE